MSEQHPRPKAGDVYITEGQGEARIVVNRVARDGAWADIRVTAKHDGSSWTKRQPLRDGCMPYPVRNVADEISTAVSR